MHGYYAPIATLWTWKYTVHARLTDMFLVVDDGRFRI